MKPLGDGFIRLITMVITLVIFCTVVSGIAGMQDIKKIGRVGGKALLYFEIVSTLALLLGLIVGNLVHPGSGLNVDPASLDARAVSDYAGQAKAQNPTEFLLHIIPTTVVDAFAKGDILQVLLVALLFGFAISAMGPRCQPLVKLIEALTQAVFGIVNILMRFAPIGAFGAMAFTVGKYGIVSLQPLAKLIVTFYVTSILFVLVILGSIAWVAGFNLLRFLLYIKDEIVVVLATSSSETVLATLMEKLENLGCSKSLVGLGGSNRIHLQYGRQQPLHDIGSLVCCPGYQYSPDTYSADDNFRRSGLDIQRSQRGARSRIYCIGGNAGRGSDNSSRRNGLDPWH